MVNETVRRQAINSYDQRFCVDDGPGYLNLAWTFDERACLDVEIDTLLEAALTSEATSLREVYSYHVLDPYGDGMLRPAVATYFGVDEQCIRVTAGAGVISLLSTLARATPAGAVAIVGSTYPDFPFWVESGSTEAPNAIPDGPADEQAERILDASSRLVFLERPNLLNDHYNRLEDLRLLCGELHRRDVVVLIDESNANYAPTSFSAVELLAEYDNLVVLRGLSKAYGLGGLRLGFAACAPQRCDWVRARVPPMLASSVSLMLGRQVLELGDVMGSLRTTIQTHKAAVERLLLASEIRDFILPNAWLPYVLFPEPEGPGRRALEQAGIRGKRHLLWPPAAISELHRISVPLDQTRLARFEARLATR